MRAIEEYNIKGTTSDGDFYGKVTAYTEPMKRVDKKRTPRQLRSIAFVLTAATIFTALTACRIVPEAKVTEPPAIIQESKYEYEYTVESGDSLWTIASKYYQTDNEIANEINRICKDNKIDKTAILPAGKKLKIKIPQAALEVFGVQLEFIPTEEWEKINHFVEEAFEVPKDEVHKDNHGFWLDKEYAIDLLIKAEGCRFNLEEIKADEIFYSEESFNNKEAEMMQYLYEAVEVAENATGKKYGVDFILDDEYVLIPLEPSLAP